MDAFEHIDMIEGRIYNEVRGIGYELYTDQKYLDVSPPMIGTQVSLTQTDNK